MPERLTADHADWEVAAEVGQAPQHRHGAVSATAFLYSNPDEVWAECSMCGTLLHLDDPRRCAGCARGGEWRADDL